MIGFDVSYQPVEPVRHLLITPRGFDHPGVFQLQTDEHIYIERETTCSDLKSPPGKLLVF